MSEALTFRVQSYWKLAKGEAGLTTASTRRISGSQALLWILDNMLDEQPDDGTPPAIDARREGMRTTIVIDWDRLPESASNPKIPAGR
jgi:hypothetical protein